MHFSLLAAASLLDLILRNEFDFVGDRLHSLRQLGRDGVENGVNVLTRLG